MRELGIRSVIRKKRPLAGRKQSVVFANVLSRDFKVQTPFRNLVTDIPHVRTDHDFNYLSTVMDLQNNEIVAWEVSERNNLNLVFDIIKQLGIRTGALANSDQGFQYTHKAYETLHPLVVSLRNISKVKGNFTKCIDL